MPHGIWGLGSPVRYINASSDEIVMYGEVVRNCLKNWNPLDATTSQRWSQNRSENFSDLRWIDKWKQNKNNVKLCLHRTHFIRKIGFVDRKTTHLSQIVDDFCVRVQNRETFFFICSADFFSPIDSNLVNLASESVVVFSTGRINEAGITNSNCTEICKSNCTELLLFFINRNYYNNSKIKSSRSMTHFDKFKVSKSVISSEKG